MKKTNFADLILNKYNKPILEDEKAEVNELGRPENDQSVSQAKDESKKSSCFNLGFFKRLFFIQLNHYFERDGISSDKFVLSSLPTGMHLLNLYKKFEDKRKQIYSNYEYFLKISLPLLYVIRWNLLICTTLKLLAVIISYLIPFFARSFVKNMISKKEFSFESLGSMFGVVVALLLIGVLHENGSLYKGKCKASSAQIIRGIFYNKLKNSNYLFLRSVNHAFITNFLNFDIDNILWFIGHIPILLMAPISIFLNFYIVYSRIGYIAWLPSTIFILMLSTKLLLFSEIQRLRTRYSTFNSERSEVLHRYLTNIRWIKIQQMESRFNKVLLKIRHQELKNLRSIHFLESSVSFIDQMMPILCASASISYYNYSQSRVLSVIDTYQIVALFTIFSSTFTEIGKIFNSFSYSRLSLKGLRVFYEQIPNVLDEISLENKPKLSMIHLNPIINSNRPGILQKVGNYSIKFDNAIFGQSSINSSKVIEMIIRKTFIQSKKKFEQEKEDNIVKQMGIWKSQDINIDTDLRLAHKFLSEDSQIVLKRVNLIIKPKEKVCICGKKLEDRQHLIYSVINENMLLKGRIKIMDSFTFVSWNEKGFFNGSIRDNILLDSPFHKKKYMRIVDALELDFDLYAGQDETEIINQAQNINPQDQARILIARALYQDKNIAIIEGLFDRFRFSMEKQFNRVVDEFLKDKTIIFTSDEPSLIKLSDRIIFVDDNKVVSDGDLTTLLSQDENPFQIYYHSKVKSIDQKDKEETNTVSIEEIEGKIDNIRDPVKRALVRKKTLGMIKLKVNKPRLSMANGLFLAIGGKLRKSVKGKTTANYNYDIQSNFFQGIKDIFLSDGCFSLIILGLVFFITSFGLMMIDIWLGLWSQKVFDISNLNYQYIYFVISTITSLFAFLNRECFKFSARRGLWRVYKTTIRQLLRNRISFLVKLPENRIINRLTNDLNIIDEVLVNTSYNSFNNLFFLIGGFGILFVLTFGIYGLLTVTVWYYMIRSLKLKLKVSSIFLQKSSKYKSEMDALFYEISKCIVAFRNIGKGDYYDERINSISNFFQNAFSHMANGSSRWLGTRIYLSIVINYFVVYAICLFAFSVYPSFFLSRLWIISFILSWVTKIRSNVSQFSINFTASQSYMLSYFRIREYWPHKCVENDEGTGYKLKVKTDKSVDFLDIKRINFSYNSEIMALKNINLVVECQEKLFILGKEGSGKKTFINLLLRLYDQSDEDIVLNSHFKLFGKNIEEISPKSIRQNISYLGAKPKLLQGKVKEIIDPSGQFDENTIVKVLHFLGFMRLKNSIDIQQFIRENIEEKSQYNNYEGFNFTMSSQELLDSHSKDSSYGEEPQSPSSPIKPNKKHSSGRKTSININNPSLKKIQLKKDSVLDKISRITLDNNKSSQNQKLNRLQSILKNYLGKNGESNSGLKHIKETFYKVIRDVQ